MGNLFLRTGVVCLLLGLAGGMYLGMHEDLFGYAPVHAHLNLVGGVVMILSGLIYNSQPGLAPRLAPIHFGMALAGILLIVPGIYGSISHLPWSAPVVGIGSLLTFVATAMLAWVIFTMKKPA